VARPRVRNDDLLRGVGNGRREFTALEERDVETQAQHVLKTVVDVNAPSLKVVGHQRSEKILFIRDGGNLT
jgi:hypothetical protein